MDGSTKCLFLISCPLHFFLTICRNIPWPFYILSKVIVFNHSLATVIDSNRPISIFNDAVTAQGWIATLRYCDSYKPIAENIIVLQYSLTIFVNKNATLFSIVDAVATQGWIATPLDFDSCK